MQCPKENNTILICGEGITSSNSSPPSINTMSFSPLPSQAWRDFWPFSQQQQKPSSDFFLNSPSFYNSYVWPGMKKHRLRASDKNNAKIQTPLHADKWLIINNVAMIYLVQFPKSQMSNAMICDVTPQLFLSLSLSLSLSTIRAHNQSQPHFFAQVNF